MKRIIIVLTVGLLLALGLGGQHASALFDGAKDQACQGINLTDSAQSNGCGSTDLSNGIGVDNLIHNAINAFSIVVGVIAVIMIIVGGVKYITSSGDSNSVNSAKNTILYALVGLVVVALAQVIVRFVLHKAVETSCPKGTTLVKGVCQ
jgi:amino acid transporter